MKNNIVYFATAALLLLLASCEEELSTPKDNLQEKVIAINGWISSGDTLHTVKIVESSTSDGLVEAEGVAVSIYVNGMLSDRSSAGQRHGTPTKEYSLKARFAPGDTVEIRAEGPDCRASVSSVIPEAPVVSGADYEGKAHVSYWEGSKSVDKEFNVYKFNLSDPDNKGDAYSVRLFREAERILIADDYGEDYPFPSHYPVGWSEAYPKTQIDAYNMLEPAMVVDQGLSDYINSNFTLFTDRYFCGAEYRVSILSVPGNWVEYMNTYGGRETWSVKMKTTIRVEAIPSEAYRYYVDANFTGGGYVPMFYEPPVFPTNVKGGIGYVCFASATEIEGGVEEVLVGWRGRKLSATAL